MQARPLTDDEVAIIDGWLLFNYDDAALELSETPWHRLSRRDVLERRMRVLDALRVALRNDKHYEWADAQRVAEFASRP